MIGRPLGPNHSTRHPIPAVAGVGLRTAHYADALASVPAWVEVHPENYMCAGGPHHRVLTAMRATCPLSFHGVGLSLGGWERPHPDHLGRLVELLGRYQPEIFSEHLAWSSFDGVYLNDLLPVPYTRAALARLGSHVDEVQERLRRRILIENPSLYLRYGAAEMSEPEFLRELAQRTGCGLLLDINNVHVSSVNCGFDATQYLAAFPIDAIGEVHLAGHAVAIDGEGRKILIDTHGARVDPAVWNLYRRLIRRTGPLPTLIEWDRDLPEWTGLLAEALRADKIVLEERRHVAAE
ncbi:DUF692 family multinuclear iron-containing protein [Dongia sp.]|uniref:MNIO family bufferin maturase n=1 Tax=Dongia sp. TaxID=1977262 RepID=UPI0035B3A52D